MRFVTFFFLVMFSKAAFSAEPEPPAMPADARFVQLLEATRFIANYKETAAVSARVFAARAQGSDRKFAEFMAKVAISDLNDMQLCMSRAYASGPLSSADAENLIQIFGTPLGKKVLDLSQRTLIADLERGRQKSIDPLALTDAERRNLANLYQTPVFQRYNAYITSQAFALAVKDCLASSQVGKESGLGL